MGGVTHSAQGKSKPKRKRGIKHHFDLAEDILMCVDENIAHYRKTFPFFVLMRFISVLEYFFYYVIKSAL